MKAVSRIGFLFIVTFIFSSVYSQGTGGCDEGSGGSDPLLINGRIYTYVPPPRVLGDQYLREAEFSPGILVIRGIRYTGRQLNYDIRNQEILLKYTRLTGAPQIISVSRAWLSEFTFDGRDFLCLGTEADEPGIYQVIGNGPLKIFYHWEKRLDLKNVAGDTRYIFSKSIKKMYLVDKHEFQLFKNNRTFLKLLDPDIQVNVKKYLRERGVRVQKAPDETMRDLINYCNTL